MAEATASTTRWDTLEQRSATAFLVAGSLLSFATVAYGLELVTSVSIEGLLTGLPVFIGLTIAYIGLLGMYPVLAIRAPRLALTGIALIVAPVILLVLLLVFALASLLVELPEPSIIGALFMVIFIGFALGILLFGGASLWTQVPSRTVGVFLLVFAAPWFVLLGAGADPPTWLEFGTVGTMAVAVLAIGHLLRSEPEQTDRTEPAPTEVHHD